MKRSIITTIVLCCIASTAIIAQGNKNKDRQYNSEEERKRLVTNFRNTYERARDRIDRLQENAPLHREVTYEEEEEFLRKAQQILSLLDDGHYVKRSELKEYEKKLNELGNQGKPGQAQANQSNRNNQSATSSRPSRQEDNEGNESLWNARIIRSDKIVSTSADRIESSRQRIILAKKRLDEQFRDKKITEAEYNSKMNRVKQAEERINDLEERLKQEKQRIDELKQQIGERSN
jgi:DNA repair exonuclease SbcCD ATPase subunit